MQLTSKLKGIVVATPKGGFEIEREGTFLLEESLRTLEGREVTITIEPSAITLHCFNCHDPVPLARRRSDAQVIACTKPACQAAANRERVQRHRNKTRLAKRPILDPDA